MNISKSTLYSDLDRGDGVCRYFNDKNKLCTIYNQRPVKCNIDKMYDLYFKNKIRKEEYYHLNYEGCLKLRDM